MKVNKVPEKIYIHEASAPELTEKLPYHLEYIHKDAFIEKLECWLNEKGREYYGEFDEGFLIEFNTSEEAIADFKKYLKR